MTFGNAADNNPPHFPSPTSINGAQKYGCEVEIEIGFADGD
jgi:hypothetical protein